MPFLPVNAVKPPWLFGLSAMIGEGATLLPGNWARVIAAGTRMGNADAQAKMLYEALFEQARCQLAPEAPSRLVDLEAFPGDTVDINSDLDPTYVDDAQTLEGYDLVLADPPYSGEDAEHYGTTIVKRNLVMDALQRLWPGTHVVWLDQILPMYRKDVFAVEARIGIWRSTNHRIRGVTILWRL